MAYEQEYENGCGLPARAAATDVTLSGGRTSGRRGTREPVRGLWPARGLSSVFRFGKLTVPAGRLLLCAAAGLCLLAVCAFLTVRGLSGHAAGESGDRLPGAIGLSDASDTAGEPERDTEPSPAPEPPSDAVTDTVTAAEAASGIVTEPDTEPETQPPVPVAGEGAVLRDMSESERGPDYMINDTSRDPAAVPAWVPDGAGKPVVLLVCSRPYDGYADGDGGGTVSDLAETLAAELRRRGVTVIFVNRALTGLTKDSSVPACREKTQSLIRYYCRLYGDITLVMDVRRGAELVEGSLLATAGTAGGQPGAQLRLIADGRRPGEENGIQSADLDLSLAAAIRRGVYEVSPTASRPVLWRDNAGLIPDGLCGGEDGPRLVTVELGSAGNTYSSAAALIPLLARSTAAALGQ